MSDSTFNPLEPRQLLSHGHTAPSTLDPAALEVAKQAVMVDYDQLVAHVEANKAAVTTARQTLTDHLTAASTELSSLSAAVKADQKAISEAEKTAAAQKTELKAQWSAVVLADQADVDTLTEGETDEELAADQQKLYSDVKASKAAMAEADAQARLARAGAVDAMQDDIDALHDATKDMKRQKKKDETAVRSAERTLKDVFQSDRKILDREIKRFKKGGFNTSDLDLPALPKV